MSSKDRARHKNQLWQEAAKRHHLTDDHIEMGKKLGLNPKNFSKYAGSNSMKNQRWKKPLAQFIEKKFAKKYTQGRLAAIAKAGIEASKKRRHRQAI